MQLAFGTEQPAHDNGWTPSARSALVSGNTHMSLSCPTLICQDEVRHNKCSLLEATGCGQRQCGHARRGPWRRRRRRQRRGSITLASSLTFAKTSAAPRSFNGGGSSTPLYDAARRHLTAAARCNATPRSRRSHRQRQPPPIERSTVTACPRRSKLGSGATLMAQVNSERQNVSTPEAERDGAIGKGRGRSPLATATS